MPRISAYSTEDGMIFRNRQDAKEHEYWLALVELQRSIPGAASSEPIDELERQRAAWLLEHAKAIAKFAKYARNHAKNGATGPHAPETEAAS